MAYCTRADIEPLIPEASLAEALRDPATKAETVGLMAAIIESACVAIDAALCGKFTTPLTGTVPAVVRRAAIVISLETLWRRKGVSGDGNPWKTEADAIREHLREIATGRAMLGPTAIASFSETERVFDESDSSAHYEVTDE